MQPKILLYNYLESGAEDLSLKILSPKGYYGNSGFLE